MAILFILISLTSAGHVVNSKYCRMNERRDGSESLCLENHFLSQSCNEYQLSQIELYEITSIRLFLSHEKVIFMEEVNCAYWEDN